jgi:hypothetical protein
LCTANLACSLDYTGGVLGSLDIITYDSDDGATLINKYEYERQAKNSSNMCTGIA